MPVALCGRQSVTHRVSSAAVIFSIGQTDRFNLIMIVKLILMNRFRQWSTNAVHVLLNVSVQVMFVWYVMYALNKINVRFDSSFSARSWNCLKSMH